jgi:ADP-ribosylglycohydrolase
MKSSETRSEREKNFNYRKIMIPHYEKMYEYELYFCDVMTEYKQCIDEGLDIEEYKPLFEAVSRLPKGEISHDLGEVIFKIVCDAKIRDGYKYTEPSDLEGIRAQRKPYPLDLTVDKERLAQKIKGAWLGRICGCMLGKPIEGIRTNELIPFLQETDNYPMHRYIYKSELTPERLSKYKFTFTARQYVDEIDGMPSDDDLNYVMLAQQLISNHGSDFDGYDVLYTWVENQLKHSFWTAERVAYINFIKGYAPPQTAVYKNPYREWIGAQIRGDYFGYINPGNPEAAAEMAFNDASVSHVKNGIYGEMFASAMIAIAASTSNIEDIVLGGLAQIPSTSRLYEEVMLVYRAYKNGASKKEALKPVYERYDEQTAYGWCHVCPNAMIVAASLLYSEGDYSRAICLAVEAGYDTDCNGATVGSVFGMAYGIEAIPEYWTKPFNDTLYTALNGFNCVKISDRIALTLEHMEQRASFSSDEAGKEYRPEVAN